MGRPPPRRQGKRAAGGQTHIALRRCSNMAPSFPLFSPADEDAPYGLVNLDGSLRIAWGARFASRWGVHLNSHRLKAILKHGSLFSALFAGSRGAPYGLVHPHGSLRIAHRCGPPSRALHTATNRSSGGLATATAFSCCQGEQTSGLQVAASA